jgi:hypothetical protein
VEQVEMRSLLTIVTVALVVLAAVLMIFWFGTDLPAAFHTETPAPGQYPIDRETPEWPGVRQTSAFAPATTMGSNTTASDGTDAAAPKVTCALGRGPCSF